MIAGVSDSNMQMKVVVPFWAIISIVIVSILTIFISSFIPARKASKITPIDAIRQRQEIKVKHKKLKSPNISEKYSVMKVSLHIKILSATEENQGL